MSEYESDLVIWSHHQAKLLRRMGAGEHVNDQVDWGNLAEEIESFGNSDRRELRSRIHTVLRHLIKLRLSPAELPRTGWLQTIAEQRVRIRRLLEDSPSLRQFVPEAIGKELPSARDMALTDTAVFQEQPTTELHDETFGVDEVLGPGFPG